ncbi:MULTISPECIES: hypothetical protein [Thermococcus]|uniref:Uncharacterized protein n=2 Tax=Thermococcus barophilus TaxID=55802 RepID=A0A0S1XAS0_THEBA|nr:MULTISPECIES: hypothetical protein [Thermococcus]ADT83743.1 hypothetical protein TERMP_00766 [Thermococcus barophilus MP]ALM74890.1 hypothetical protein TBCH5v1_0944 [Thermococcus barophilus]WRS52949.1 hypothetical protein VFC49_01990 [Thermococcus sp. SY098]
MDVFELARRYHQELGIKEPSFATLAAEIFGELGLKIYEHLKGEGYTLKSTRFIDYDKSLVLEVVKEEKAFEILLRKA